MDSMTVLDMSLAEVGFYFRLVQVFFALIVVITVFLLFVYRSMRRARHSAQESAEYAQAVTEARETERRRIARELHDTVAGGLRRLGFLLYETGRTSETATVNKAATASEAAEWCDTLIKETRDICQSLYPPDFTRLPFTASLQDLCARFEERSGVSCVFSTPEDFEINSLNTLPTETQFQCFRIIQEALANIEKYARAHEASLVIRPAEKDILFIISDDGVGLNASNAGSLSAPGGLGLRAMQDRAKLVGGSLAIESSPDAGVMVTLQVPAGLVDFRTNLIRKI
jgi:signal transduction histidine kinase